MKNTIYIIGLIIAIWLMNIPSVYAFSEGDVDWASAISGTLYKGDILTNGDYTVKAKEFSSPVMGKKTIGGDWVPEEDVDPMVIIEIYKKDVLLKEMGMGIGDDAYIDPDYEVRVSITDLPAKNAKDWIYQYYNPWATVNIQLRAVPKLEVTIDTDKTEYTSNGDTEIVVTARVTNTGETFAKEVDLDLDPSVGGLEPRNEDNDQFHEHYTRLEKGESKSFEVKLLVPNLFEEKTYTLNGTAKGYDIKDLEYNAEKESTTITILPKPNYLIIYKSARDNIYLSETDTVWVTVVNGGIYDVYDIKVRDSIDNNFVLENDTSLNWNISTLKPGEDWKMSYDITPINVNIDGFTIPSATVEFTANNKQYTMTSEQPNIIVNGPKIVARKTIDKRNASINEYVVVTVTLNNIGNIATKVDIQDFLPDNVTLISGSTRLNSTYLELRIPQKLTYTIRMDTDKEVILSPARINYTDIIRKGPIKSVIYSNSPAINSMNFSESDLTGSEPSSPKANNLSLDNSSITNTTLDNTSTPQVTETYKIKSLPKETPKSPGFDIIYAMIALIIIIMYEMRTRT